MNIKLIQGEFIAKDAIEIITKMVNVKIKFHEDKIQILDNEEDIKMREFRIKQLQKELSDLRNTIKDVESGKVGMTSVIEVN